MRRALENRRLKIENRAYQTNLESLVEARTQQLNNTMRNLERSYDITLEALGDALDLKDAETEGHSKRVTAFTIAMAKHMGLTDKEIRVIARGAFLHDIGKMAIPDAILRKPGALNPDEIAIMREHCYRGYQMLKKIPFLSEASDIVYAHQEKYDGTGYPRGLKGNDIPLGARIFSVADTLDAITSDRPYRPGAVSACRSRRNSRNGLDVSLIPMLFGSFSPCRKISGAICAKKSTRRFTALPTPPPPNPEGCGAGALAREKPPSFGCSMWRHASCLRSEALHSLLRRNSAGIQRHVALNHHLHRRPCLQANVGPTR